MISRTQRRLHTGNYSAAVVPGIRDAQVSLSSETMASVDDATAAIARFDAELSVDLGPFASLLLRSESAASSQIENLSATAQTIALTELGASARGNGALVVANGRAMEAAIALADRLDESSILETHRVLLERSAPAVAGKWRTEQVWIGGTSFGPHRADFVPPHHRHIAEAISDLVEFLARDDMPVLVHAALAHAQFETIHPFPDGNGRTGRALVHALLAAKGLTRRVTVPISAGLLLDVDAYFAALGTYRAGEPETIVALLADSVFLAIENATLLVDELRAATAEWSETVSARPDSVVWKILDLLPRQPIVSSPLVQEATGVSAVNVLRAIDQLVATGVLNELSGQRRNRFWAAPAVLDALDAFAERAARRR